MLRVSLAASAGCEDDRHIAEETAAGLSVAPACLAVAPAAAAGSAISIDPSITIATPLTKPLIGRIVILP
jgi:hypothetical protein